MARNKIKKSAFYLVNIDTLKFFKKPFKTMREAEREITYSIGNIIKRKKGFEKIIATKLAKYKILSKKAKPVKTLRELI